jgi:hypothetical protein
MMNAGMGTKDEFFSIVCDARTMLPGECFSVCFYLATTQTSSHQKCAYSVCWRLFLRPLPKANRFRIRPGVPEMIKMDL